MTIRSLCLFACCYHGAGLPANELALAAELLDAPFDRVVLLACDPIDPSCAKDPPAALANHPRFAFVPMENHGRDFGLYARFLRTIADGLALDRLCLVNDSILWLPTPEFPSLAKLLGIGAGAGTDAWGCTDSHEHGYHLQSYLLQFYGRPCIDTVVGFLLALTEETFQKDKHPFVVDCEIGLSKALLAAGFRLYAAFPDERVRKAAGIDAPNTTYFLPNTLRLLGCPLRKKACQPMDIG